MGRIGCAGTSPDPIPNPPIILKTTHSKPRPGHSDKGSSRKSGRHDRNSDQSTNQESVYPKGSMAAKLVAHKERDKKYRKIIENPMMYLEE